MTLRQTPGVLRLALGLGAVGLGAVVLGCTSKSGASDALPDAEGPTSRGTDGAPSPDVDAAGDRTFGGSGGTVATDGAASFVPGAPFSYRALSRQSYAEGCASADLDGDGAPDLLLGPFWYRGPGFDQPREIDVATAYPLDDASSDRRFFLEFIADLDGDAWLDVLVVGYPGTDARWYKNPGPAGWSTHWPSFPIASNVGMESPTLTNLVGLAKPQLVYAQSGVLGYATQGADPRQPWSFHPISVAGENYPMFTHGLGVGDVDGDGLADVVVSSGWYRQLPASPFPRWQKHDYDFARGEEGGAQMLVVDVDGDGDNDVITSLAAHGYGLDWFEQQPGTEAPSFVAHAILPPQNAPGNFSQLHALALVDMNRDGRMDFVTGKRWWAHLGADPGEKDPPVVAWFELEPSRQSFVQHVIHDDSGVGVQVCAGDFDGDGKPDVASSNKRGLHLLLSP